MGFKCGLVGLPNVGKSTLFNMLTKLNVASENFPFCTINPNFGIVPIFDSRLNTIASITSSNRIIPAYVEIIDIAGLVKNAHKGEGLGNKFLSHIRDTDVIVHVIRCFKSDKIVHIYGKVKPMDDIEIINYELILSDLEMCKKRLKKLQKICFLNDVNINKEILILKRCVCNLENNECLRFINFSTEELKIINYLQFLTIKPMIFVLNQSINNQNNVDISDVLKFAENKKIKVVFVSLDFSNEESCTKKSKDNSFLGIESVPLSSYHALNLITFFTAGPKEVRAWTTIKHVTINESVKCIHTDLSKGFIKAQVISYSDFIKYKGEKKSKELGKMRIEGKKYFVNDGDIINVLYKV